MVNVHRGFGHFRLRSVRAAEHPIADRRECDHKTEGERSAENDKRHFPDGRKGQPVADERGTRFPKEDGRLLGDGQQAHRRSVARQDQLRMIGAGERAVDDDVRQVDQQRR
ncbi:hypothetical protein [Cohnella algarum]|uniref:hypothetical protein n=1 Tax=Cohnella algarum TaxID=2044859 RepID=UPI00196829B0|nr:hypothetical protein [Cohnella algarum]MBN2984793.1 hypothetical protein [Cohnella algarum]